jgi:hypothetical protein
LLRRCAAQLLKMVQLICKNHSDVSPSRKTARFGHRVWLHHIDCLAYSPATGLHFAIAVVERVGSAFAQRATVPIRAWSSTFFHLHADAACGFPAGFAVVLFDDALQLARHRPPIQLATGWSCLPYLFGVAIYCFEVHMRLSSRLSIQPCAHPCRTCRLIHTASYCMTTDAQLQALLRCMHWRYKCRASA